MDAAAAAALRAGVRWWEWEWGWGWGWAVGEEPEEEEEAAPAPSPPMCVLGESSMSRASKRWPALSMYRDRKNPAAKMSAPPAARAVVVEVVAIFVECICNEMYPNVRGCLYSRVCGATNRCPRGTVG